MRRAREARKLCCVGVDLPLDAGACGRMVHAESQRCIHCTKRRWWLIKHALNGAEVAVTAILENDTLQRASEDDTLDNLPAVVPTLDDLSDLGDPCLREVPAAARAGLLDVRLELFLGCWVGLVCDRAGCRCQGRQPTGRETVEPVRSAPTVPTQPACRTWWGNLLEWRTARRATAAAVCCAAVPGPTVRSTSVPARAGRAAQAHGPPGSVLSTTGRTPSFLGEE